MSAGKAFQGTVVHMSEEKALPVSDVETDHAGGSRYRRYSIKGIGHELRHITWPSGRQVILYTGLVLLVSLLLGAGLHFVDSELSRAVLALLDKARDVPDWVNGAIGALQLGAAITTGFYAFKHPSPGDTLASIFGGEIVAQGTGLSPKERLLGKKMALSVFVFLVASLLAAVTF